QGGGRTKSKMYTGKQVRDIMQKRAKKTNEKMEETKKEQEYVKAMIVDARKTQYAEQSADGDRGALRTNDERRRAKSRGQGQRGRRANKAIRAVRREERRSEERRVGKERRSRRWA